MVHQKPLTASETMRLAVLGPLTEKSYVYAELALQARHIVERLIGPSLDLLGSSLEVLHLEGLIEGEGRQSGDQALMYLTSAGREVFERLITAPLRAPFNDIQRLSLALKLRYLDQLPQDLQYDQLMMIAEIAENEAARLSDLEPSAQSTAFAAWRDGELKRIHDLLHIARHYAEMLEILKV